MITITLTKDQFIELYDAVRDLPDIYKSEAAAGEYELDNAHYDLFEAVEVLEKIASKTTVEVIEFKEVDVDE
jgi:hypothetical protein|tara:strand:+ start:335 stop:550 length:216 start_codon:yes stop_codon:yes gene_type:complete